MIDNLLHQVKKLKEVDCIALKDGRIHMLIQVCQEMGDPKTRNREVRALCRAAVDIPYARDARLLILSQGPGEVIRHDGLDSGSICHRMAI
jgi:predicted AAA+ superfamily ATPase